MPLISRGGRWLLAASLLALLNGCGGRDSGSGGDAARNSLPIGAVIALTGNSSGVGQDQRIGLELARDHFRDQKPRLELRLEDGGSEEQTATNAFRGLINGGVLALIGPSLSQQAFAVDPLAERAGVPVVGPSNTAVGVPQIGRFISRVSAPVSVVAPLSIEAALRQNPGIRRVAVFFAHDDAYSSSESTIFQNTLRQKGLPPVTVQRTNVSDTDFQNQVTDALRLRPDLIVISALPNDGGNLVRQIRELGYKGPIVAGNGMNSPNIYPICQKYCDGLLIAQAYSPEARSAINDAFLAAYRRARGGAIPPQFSAQAFTAYQVVAEALQSLQTSLPPGQTVSTLPTAELRKRLNAAILAGSYDTPLGPIRFTPEGEVIQQSFHVAQVRMNPDGSSGRFELLP